MTERISLRRLDYFVTAAESGTMTAAAGRLHVSQSAVSMGISELERQLGVALVLRRKAKGLTLTEAGRLLLPEARALLACSDELRAGMAAVGRTLAGRLKVGCFTTIAPFLVPRLLEDFRAVHPDVTVDLAEGSLDELQELLLDGRCELAVLYETSIRQDIEYDVLYEASPHVLLPPAHPLARRDTVALADLAGHDMVMLDVPPSMDYFTGLLAGAGVDPAIRHRTASFEMVRSLVARGAGYSLLIQRPRVGVSYEGLPVEVRPIGDPVVPMRVVLARAAGARLTRRAAAFAHFCRTDPPREEANAASE
ncbi:MULTISPECIES: LysR family transcriptional regulator [Actinomadura]|uniref:LysR family transcriptional regulator n=1 Tax=Actinomadura litoris TaxID=2678616 RepID=A0A7K1KUA9_9ACTN|nr:MULTISPECIES: LysR family transcriptional regulator [Actinomadura]MBT2207476.1 LysR family transcriptional regulator [Actinomadura sp. NEAU-AAG7]MUN35713.1 LysR family transcriptional regulator [Actinomadura litoris]